MRAAPRLLLHPQLLAQGASLGAARPASSAPRAARRRLSVDALSSVGSPRSALARHLLARRWLRPLREVREGKLSPSADSDAEENNVLALATSSTLAATSFAEGSAPRASSASSTSSNCWPTAHKSSTAWKMAPRGSSRARAGMRARVLALEPQRRACSCNPAPAAILAFRCVQLCQSC